MRTKTFFLIAAITLLSACKTIDVWDKGYPRPSSELTTETAKQEEFNKFAIYEGNATHSEDGYIQTQKDKETDKYYSLGSFSPVIAKVSPDGKQLSGGLASSPKNLARQNSAPPPLKLAELATLWQEWQ